jgi:hypothetical protein
MVLSKGGMIEILVWIVFKVIFYLKIYYNNIFLIFLKNIFDIKTSKLYKKNQKSKISKNTKINAL